MDSLSIANLSFQVVALALLFVGFALARRGRYEEHETVMRAVIAVGTSSLLIYMINSLLRSFRLIFEKFPEFGIVAIVLHVAVGVFGVSLTAYNVLNVKEKLPAKLKTYNVRRVMRITFATWLTIWALGLSFYAYYFVL